MANPRTANSKFAIGGVLRSADSLVVAENFGLSINISGKNPAHRKSAKRWQQFRLTKIMKSILTLICLLSVNIKVQSQIDCFPKVGDRFAPIRAGVNLRIESNLNSEIALKSPDDGGIANKGIRLICVKEGFENDFVKVQVLFWNYTMEEFGINKNLEFLLEKLRLEHFYENTFKSFYYEMLDTTKAMGIYELVRNDEWLQSWSNEQDNDMSTFGGFLKYWVTNSSNQDKVNYILDSHERILFVHKSMIENTGWVLTASGPDFKIDYYKLKLEEFQQLFEDKSCNYSSTAVYTHLNQLVQLLFEEESYFEAIKIINSFERYLVSNKEKYQIDNLKMQASYYDNNIKGALDIGQNLILAYKNQKIKSDWVGHFGEVDMSAVYGITISCLLNLDKFQEALLLSNECLRNTNLQYPQYTEFHAAILLSLGKKSEACNFLNEAYMKGNEKAREMYLENCE